MHPRLCSIGPVDVHSYGVMLAIAVVVCTFFLSRDVKGLGITLSDIGDLVFWTVLAGLAGARMFYVLLNAYYFLSHPVEILFVHHGGLAVQGGVIFGALAFFLFVKKKQWDFWVMADRAAPYLALGQGIGRIGCFLNGCCYGHASRFGIFFPVHGLRLIPTQLYASAAFFLTFFILKSVRNKEYVSGLVLGLYLILWGLQRFIIEFFRADHSELFLGLSVFQCVSIGVMLAGGLVIVLRTRKTHPHV